MDGTGRLSHGLQNCPRAAKFPASCAHLPGNCTISANPRNREPFSTTRCPSSFGVTMTTKLGLVAFAACAVAVSGDARACMHSDEYVAAIRKPSVAPMLLAEQAMSEGRVRFAASLLAPNRRHLALSRAGDDPLADRALRVAAQAIVRTRGDVDVVRDQRRPLAPADNLRWALYTLRALQARRPDATIATDLAEALAAAGEREAAWQALTDLEQKDLMATAQGYAALARLRRETGDGARSWLRYPLQAAHEPVARVEDARCRTMARTAAVCDPLRS